MGADWPAMPVSLAPSSPLLGTAGEPKKTGGGAVSTVISSEVLTLPQPLSAGAAGAIICTSAVMWLMPSASGVVNVYWYSPGNPATGVAKPTGVEVLLPRKMASRKPGVAPAGLNGIGITPATGVSGATLPGRSFKKM